MPLPDTKQVLEEQPLEHATRTRGENVVLPS